MASKQSDRFLYDTLVLLNTASYLEVRCIGGDLKETLGQRHQHHENFPQVWWTRLNSSQHELKMRLDLKFVSLAFLSRCVHGNPTLSQTKHHKSQNTHRQNDRPQLQVGKQSMLTTWDIQDTWSVGVKRDSEKWEQLSWLTYLCWMASKQPCNLEELSRKHCLHILQYFPTTTEKARECSVVLQLHCFQQDS